MSEVKAISNQDPAALKQRLARLSLSQRAALARRLGKKESEVASSGGAAHAILRARPLRVEEHGSVTVYPASHGQQRMWFLHHYAPESPVYCVPSSFHLAGPLNVAWLEAAFRTVIQRHDMLRTTFVLENGELLQRVAAKSSFNLQHINLEGISADTRRAAAERSLDEEACRPFDLAGRSPFRAVLVKLQPDEHVLLLVFHHIIFDGWSRSNFYRELSAAYEGLAIGQPVPLRELRVQFADYSAWEKDWMMGGALAEQAAYWNAKLAGETATLDLPSDRARPATESFRGGRYSQRLDPALITTLKLRAQEEGATLFMILLAAFKTLLHRYTGHDDLIVGVPVANRRRVELEDLIGYFVNTLVMRTALSSDLTFRELLRRVKETAVEAYANQDMPFERLVELLQVRRDASRTPLFQASFAFQDFPAVELKLPGIQTAPWFVTTHTSKFDFSLTMECSAEGWTAAAEYSTDLFEAGRVERMLEHWRVILENIATNPAQRVSEIPLLTAAERQQILVEWNRTERDYPRDKCIHQLFEEQVQRMPEAVAVVFEGRSLTYRELNARANQLAHHLRSLGVGADVLIGLCVERSAEMLVALLGILKAGGVYVPLDPHFPPSRLALILEDAAPAVLLTQRSLAHLTAAFTGPRVWMEEWEPGEVPDAPGVNISPTNAAYVIYTSGSTGRPKGVVIEHRSVVNFLHSMRTRPGICERDVLLAVTTISFDISVLELFLPLTVGARVVVAPEEARSDGAKLIALLKESRATLFFSTPVTWRILLHAGWAGTTKLRALIGGEALPPDLAREIHARCAELWNLYGPTETSVFSLVSRIESPDHITIGTAIANTSVYLVDRHGQPVPVGVPGELLIGGVGLARGYLNQPLMTSERFISNRFSSVPGARLYRTGDLGRWLPDGNIEFLGRADHQVKIRGYRVEPGEIETALGNHPEVGACAVVARAQGGGEKTLAAFIVVRGKTAQSVESLRHWLGARLPDYMIPSQFVEVPALPLTPNGKVDKKALEKLDGVELAMNTDYVAPRNERERILAEIWQTVLCRNRVGIHDNFFNLGGHSLQAVVICAEISKRFELEVPLRRLFEHPTIAMFSASLPRTPNVQLKAAVATDAARQGRVHPLSPGQFQLWFLDQLGPGSALYILPLLLRLRGTLNLAALKQSLTELVRRHESLRTIFKTENHQPLAYVLPVTEVPLEVIAIDAAGLDRERESRRRAEDFVRQPFDLATGPVFRAGLVCLNPDDQILALAMHHIVSDGWSLEVIQRDLAQCYGRMLEGLEPNWAPLPMPFSDHVDWQQKQLANGELARQLAYWRQQLAGVPLRLKLPTDHPRPGRQAHLGAIQSDVLDRSLTQDLKRLAQANDATLFLVVLSAFEVLLQRLSGQDDFVVGTPASGRLLVETQEMVGFFMTSLPLRANLAGEPAFLEVLKRCRETFLQATENHEAPLHQILAELQTERNLRQTPLFQVFINHLSYERKPCVFEGLEAELITPAVIDAKFDLTLYLEELDGRLKLELAYDRALFKAERIREMLRQFESLLAQLVSSPERCIQSYSLAAPSPPARMPTLDVPFPAPWAGGIADRFREQAERTPEAVAVVSGEDTLTYGELHYRSNQLAHYLQRLGVGPEVMVGLCLERSLDMAVALLAVLRAGGAVVPIEPNLPRERIEFILTDTQMPWMLTQSSLQGKLPATDARMLFLDQTQPSLPISVPDVFFDPVVKPENIAFTIYTSGSTGRPKGVLISQAAYLNYCGPAIQFWQLNASDRVLQFARFGFDVSIDQLLTPLLAGATVVLRAAEIWDPAVFTKVIEEHRLTMVHLPSAYWQKWIETISQDAVGKTIGNLRLIQVGGDVMPVAAARRWRELRIPSVRLINRYGPTETTMFSMAYEVPAEPPAKANANRIPIGRAVGPRTIHILDAQRNPVPAGVVGEIYIGGETIARGYWNRPELTAEHFIPDPFSNRVGARLYQTGDLGRLLPDGSVDFFGRADYQVKIRGYRIELGEIEAVLGGHPEINSCAVVAQELRGEDKSLVAFVVSRTTAQISNESLRQWLVEKLPDYMIPSRFVLLRTLPLTSNGKLDRKALEILGRAEQASVTDYVAPRSERERELAEIWQAVLRRERVGMHDNFFELGGHSLLAVVICSKLNERFDLKVPLRWIFEHPTIECLAKRMTSNDGQINLRAIAKADLEKPLPMSFAQQGMWLLQQTLPDAATYNQPTAWRFSGRVDRKRVHRSLQVIQARHEVLRTALVQQDGNLLQQVLAAEEITLPWQEVDLQAVPPDQQPAVLAERLLAEARRPFDLAQAPLWRAVWIALAPDEQVLVFTFHHSIVDEWSLRLFFDELERLYATDGQVESAQLSALRVQYADYAIWQRERLTGNFLEQQRSYWKEQLQELPPALELPTDLPRPVLPSGRGATHHFQIAGSVVTKFRALAREENATLFTVLLAAFQVWLHRYTGQPDIVVGTPITGRERPEFQSLLGFFLNTLPIRARLEGNHSFKKTVRQVRATLLDAFSHAELPFEQMVELAVKEREANQQPLYQVMFVLLEAGLNPLHLDQIQSRRVPMRTGTSKNDLTLSIQAGDQTWDCQFEYVTDLFTTDRVTRMARHLTELLRSITENWEQPIRLLNLMPAAERQQVLVEWNQTERDYPRDKCIHQLFEEQVERTPEAVAVVFEGDSLSYRDLNARANQLAHHLQHLGVKPEILVGLFVERSLEMVVGLLGILKAGGAYVPLDPSYPPDRLVFMLADAQSPVVVTQKTLAINLAAAKAQPVCLDSDWPEISRGPRHNPASDIQPDNLAYVIYTSGSTGTPKGSLISHYNVVRLFQATRDWFHFAQSDVWTLFHSIAFDFSVWELWGPLFYGGRLVIVPFDVSRAPETFHRLLHDEGVTVLNQTPSAFRQLIRVDEGAERKDPRSALALRLVIFGGEALDFQSLKPWFDLHGDQHPRLVNMYGITETTVHVTYRPIFKADLSGGSVIGRPIPDLQVYLLDEQKQLLPIGVPGEIYVGGAGVGRGYLNRPELTTQKFVPDPIRSRPGNLVYRSGDLGRFLPSGDLEYLGRIDQQVKIRGFRIELGEIESVLSSHAAIREGVVVARENAAGEKRLVAYLVVQEEPAPTVVELREFLLTKLPDYMLPNAFVWLEQLPLTPNGKLDRKAFPAPDPSNRATPGDINQPINLLELELLSIWQQLFEREDIGRQDNFFALGGHSLLATRLAAEIDKLIGHKLPIASLFQSPTIETLARWLADKEGAPPWSSLVPLQPLGSKPPLFFIHGAGDSLYEYPELAKLLPPDQPSYGIQAVGLDGKSARHTSVEEMAAHYVKEILSFQADGPFYLAGYSMAGLIAFEMAQQLHRRGQRVAVLALLDSAPIALAPWAIYRRILTAKIRDHFLHHLRRCSSRLGRCLSFPRRWWEMSNRDRISYFYRRWASLQRLLAWSRSKLSAVAAPTKVDGQPPHVPGFAGYYHAVAAAYRPRPYLGSADVFVSDGANPGWNRYWRKLVRGGVSFHRVPGGHHQIVFSQDHRRALARLLTNVLHRAQEKERTAQSRSEHPHEDLVS